MAPTEPPSKKQKTEAETKEAEQTKEALPTGKVAEPLKELEEDAPKATGAKIKDAVVFHTPDTTMNVMSSVNSNVLMSLSDGGVRHLLAGARASVGTKAGRYMFEAKVLEQVHRHFEGGKTVKPQQVLKIGLSTVASSLFLGEAEDSLCFDTDGYMTYNKVKTFVGKSRATTTGAIFSVVVNLTSGANSNTVSLFRDGVRVGQPQALPEALKGKTLFPTFTFRNISLHVNFGPLPMAPLTFTCNMFQDALTKESEVTPAPKASSQEVLLPLALPGEGGFDWLDAFLAKHPQYTELSDRAIMEWCMKSGISVPTARTSTDKPMPSFGIPDLDDASIRRSLLAVAPLQDRSYVVMELKSNLVKEEREKVLARFAGFKTVAQVVVGEPTSDFRKYTSELLLKQKQAASDLEFKKKKAEEASKKLAEKRAKQIEKARRKMEKDKKKKLEEAQKAKKAAEAKAAGKEVVEEEEKEKELEEEEEQENVEEEEPEEAETAEEPPKVSLTAEEEKQVFRTTPVPDLTPTALNRSLTSFGLPSKEEGFKEIRYAWSKDAKCEAYFKKWVRERKLVTRIEDLKPGEAFRIAQARFQAELAAWQNKQKTYKADLAKKAAEKAAKAVKIATEKAAAAKASATKTADDPKDETKAEEAEKQADISAETEEDEVDFDGCDIFGVKDVNDIGDKMPLFKDFGTNDWTLLSLAFELHILPHAFLKDANDAERGGMHVDHVDFYYNKYFKKPLALKSYGVESVEQLVGLVKDVVYIQDNCLHSLLEEVMETFQVFVKIVEEARRYRAHLLEMGEESAKLKFKPLSIMKKVGAKALLRKPGLVTKGKGTGKGVGKHVGKSAAKFLGVAKPLMNKKFMARPSAANAFMARRFLRPTSMQHGKGNGKVNGKVNGKGHSKGKGKSAEMKGAGKSAGIKGTGKAAEIKGTGKAAEIKGTGKAAQMKGAGKSKSKVSKGVGKGFKGMIKGRFKGK